MYLLDWIQIRQTSFPDERPISTKKAILLLFSFFTRFFWCLIIITETILNNFCVYDKSLFDKNGEKYFCP